MIGSAPLFSFDLRDPSPLAPRVSGADPIEAPRPLEVPAVPPFADTSRTAADTVPSTLARVAPGVERGPDVTGPSRAPEMFALDAAASAGPTGCGLSLTGALVLLPAIAVPEEGRPCPDPCGVMWVGAAELGAAALTEGCIVGCACVAGAEAPVCAGKTAVEAAVEITAETAADAATDAAADTGGCTGALVVPGVVRLTLGRLPDCAAEAGVGCIRDAGV